MIYSVSILNSDGSLRKRLSSKRLTKKHWEKFEKAEKTRQKVLVKGIKTTEDQKLFRKYRMLENLCDEFNYDYG